MKLLVYLFSFLMFSGIASAGWWGPGMDIEAMRSVDSSPEREAYAQYMVDQEFPQSLAKFTRLSGEEVVGVSCESFSGSPSAATLIAKLGTCQFQTASGETCTSGLIGGGCEDYRPTKRFFQCGSITRTIARTAEAMAYNKRIFKAQGCIAYPDPISFERGDRWCSFHPTAPACHGNFCRSYPSDPACRQAGYCTSHPTAPQCRLGR